MIWSEITIHTTNEAIEPVANILHESGASGVVIEDPNDLHKQWDDQFGEIYELDPQDFPTEGVFVKAYLPVNSFLGETVEQVKQALNNLLLYDFDLGHGTITLSEIHEEEWATAWKKYYKPVAISGRVTITPTWEDYTPKADDELVIELDPGMAFGTGTHPTTVMCVQALEKYIKGGEKIVDVGCGTGVLSIAAAKLGAEEILALDLDEQAVKIATINAKLNRVKDQIEVKQNNLIEGIQGPVDIVVANILSEVIIRFVGDAHQLLHNEGLFITSGIIQTKENLVVNELEKHGFKVIEVLRIEDWVAIVAQKVV